MAFKRKSKAMSFILTLAMLLALWPGVVYGEEKPVLISATVTDTGDVELQFDMQMGDPSEYKTAFALRRYDGVSQQPTSVGLKSGDSSIIELILPTKIPGGYVYTVAYDKAVGNVQSSDGELLEAFSNYSVDNLRPHPIIAEGTLPGATLGVPYSGYSFSASEGTGPYSFSKEDGQGNLPLGLLISSAGLLSGTPSTYTGNYIFKVRVTDANGAIDIKQFSITVNPAITPLDSPANPLWDTTTPGTVKAKWNAVTGASSYNVQLYKDGVEQGSAVSVAAGTVEYDFTGDITTTGTYTFKVTAVGDGTAYSNSPQSASPEYNYTATVSAPTINSAVMDAHNNYIRVTFSEGVYGNSNQTGGINKDDFNIIFAQNGGAVSGASIRWVDQVGVAASPTGGESQVDIKLNLVDGPPSGTETITISPKANSIYSSTGVAVPDTESTGPLTLYSLLAQSFAAGYPKLGAAQAASSKQVEVLAKVNLAGALYRVLLPDGATPPTAQQIKDHADIDDNPVISWGEQVIGVNEAPILLTSGMDHNTDYDLYMVAEAGNNNFSEVKKLDIKTPPETDTRIDIAAIQGVTAPVTGKAPVTAITETTQYTGTVSWSPADNPFEAGKVYTATITLSPKPYYTLTGVAANYFTVAGVASPATNPENSGVVTAVFPATGAAPDPVCKIDSTPYTTLDAAIDYVQTGETITLLKTFTHNAPVTIENKNITFDLEEGSLTIDTASGTALTVKDCTVTLSGSGYLDAKGQTGGVLADSGTVTVRYAEATNGIGAYAENGGQITVLGDAKGTVTGAFASGTDSKVTVNDDAMSTGAGGKAVEAVTGGRVETKNAIAAGANSIGAKATGANATIAIANDATGTEGGVWALVSGNITVGGDVTADGGGSYGAKADSGGKITIDGSITAEQDYIIIGTAPKTAGDGTPDTEPEKSGYLKYTDDTSTVWVKDPTAIPDVPPKRIAAGSGFSLYLKEDGTIWAWGVNVVGQLGRGVTSTSGQPTPAQVINLSSVKAIDAGEMFALALKEDGTVWAWGTDGNGQLGPKGPLHSFSHTPIQVTELPVIQAIAAGDRFCLALDTAGNVWAWGANGDGQLGRVKVETDVNPVQIPGLSNIVAISAGNVHSMALDDQGKVWSWGDNAHGQLGNGSASDSITPVQVQGLSGLTVSSICATNYSSTLITDTGLVYAWGYNGYGKLGIASGDVASRTSPTLTLYTDAIALGGGNQSLTTLRNGGNVWASGYNASGDLGINSDEYNITVPVQVKGLNGEGFLSNIVAISSKGHSLALDAAGTIWAWGYNNGAACGVSSPTTIKAPVQVQFSGGLPQLPTVTGVSITGTSKFGQTFTAHVTYSGTPSSEPTLGYQWKRSGVTIASATISSYTLVQEDIGKSITVTVTASGTATGSQTSAAVGPVQKADGPAAPAAPALAGKTHNTVTLTANVAYQFSKDNGQTWQDSNVFSGLSASTQYTFVARVKETATHKASTASAGFSVTTDTAPSSGSPGGGGGGKPPASQSTINAVITEEGNASQKTTVPVTVGGNSGTVNLDASTMEDLFNGEGTILVTIPPITGVNDYTLQLPASTLSGSQGGGTLTLSTGSGSITLPGNMLSGTGLGNTGNIGITMSQGDKSQLTDDVREALGNRPLVQLSLTVDGKQAEWNNPAAPVTVSIPYTPTAAELADPEHITVWYIDGSGNVVTVPSGRYDPATGTVTFTTTHFSHYAVVYVQKTFGDLMAVDWARDQIQVLASKGIVRGLSDNEYAPQKNITRADFLYSLVRTLNVDAKTGGNFEDIDPGAYYYTELAIAKKLGITTGTGNNKFNPDAGITRQDMMTLTERAMRMLNKLQTQGSAEDLEQFSDRGLVASYAVDSVASVVKEGLIIGSGDKINPLGNTTRAESAVFLYRIYNR